MTTRSTYIVRRNTPERRLRALFRLCAWAERTKGVEVSIQSFATTHRLQWVIFRTEEA